MIAPPPASDFRLVRFFTLARLAAFLLVAAPCFAHMEDEFHKQMLQQQRALAGIERASRRRV